MYQCCLLKVLLLTTSLNFAGTLQVGICLSLPMAPLMSSVLHKKGPTLSLSNPSLCYPAPSHISQNLGNYFPIATGMHRTNQQVLKAALSAAWPSRQVKHSKLVMFYGVHGITGEKKKAINIPPFHSEIHQMLQSLSDSNTSHISKVVFIISLPDTAVKWFGEHRRDFWRMAQFSYFTGSQDG